MMDYNKEFVEPFTIDFYEEKINEAMRAIADYYQIEIDGIELMEVIANKLVQTGNFKGQAQYSKYRVLKNGMIQSFMEVVRGYENDYLCIFISPRNA